MSQSKYPRTPYAAFSPSGPSGRLTADVSNFLGRPLVITEKLDGSNVRLHNGMAQPRSPNSNGRHPWLAMVRKHHAWKTKPYEYLELFGEDIYGVHSIRYDSVAEDRTFYLFAAKQRNAWASWDSVCAWALYMGIPTVPVLHEDVVFHKREDLEQVCLDLMAEPSALGPEREGLVVRVSKEFEDQHFSSSVCKGVRPNHVQADEEHWSRHWEACPIVPPLHI